MVFWKDAIRLKIIAVLLALATIALVKLHRHNEMGKEVGVKNNKYEILSLKLRRARGLKQRILILLMTKKWPTTYEVSFRLSSVMR